MARINTPLRNYFFYKLGDSAGNNPGDVLTDGHLTFYSEAGYPSTLLTVYQDAALTIPYSNPLGLDDDGGCPPIYLQDEAYAIECYSSSDDLQFTVRNYEGAIFTDGGGGGGGNESIPNLFPDGQFNFPIFDGSPPAAVTPITSTDWVFERNGSGGTDILEFVRFPLGDSDVVQTPLNMLHYQVTAAASGETVKRMYFPFRYVRTLEGQQVTISFYARGTGSSTITPFYEQFFGTGGSPSTTNTVALNPLSLTGTWTKYEQTFTIAGAGGKTLGVNDDDQLRVGINYTLNGTTNTYITNMLLEEGATSTQYPYIPNNEIESQQNSVNPPGMISAFGCYNAPVGWLECDFSAVSRTTYIDLFRATSITLNGDTSNGSNEVTNVNAAKLSGGSYIEQSATTTAASAVITVTDSTQMLEGMFVYSSDFANLVTIQSVDSDTQITVTGGTALAGVTETMQFYYNLGTQFTSSQFSGVVNILKKITSTSFQASKKATASGTTGILFYQYGAGDGTTTFNVPNYQRKAIVGSGGADDKILSNGIAAYGGQAYHKMTERELKAHTHLTWGDRGAVAGGSGNNIPNFPVGDPTASTGGSEAFSIMQPSLTALICIKT